MRLYSNRLTAAVNRKGVMDVDTVKGCSCGMAASAGGCYGECYAAKTAAFRGYDFSVSVSRHLYEADRIAILETVYKHPASWYRIGVAGDPCHDWDNTVKVCELLAPAGKVPVIITKHWIEASAGHLNRLRLVGCVFNTSVSGMDSDYQLWDRLQQIERVSKAGMVSVCRVVTCRFGAGEWADRCRGIQEYLLSLEPVIDTPLRATAHNPRVLDGSIVLTARPDSVGGGASKMVSLHNCNVYLGTCDKCPDQCGVPQGGNCEE